MRKIQFLGKMPDPFKLADGTQMTKEQWLEKRDEIRNMIVDIEYGGMPPRPEYVEFERIKYVCPNNSGCHGAVSHRCYVTGQGDDEKWSERISDMVVKFPTWMGPELWNYVDKEENLPYDMHYFGALIAPRYYLQCEGLQDYWINPIGAWQNFSAVKRCYEYLGCGDHAAAWFRPGEHRHKYPDFVQFMDFMDRARAGLELAEHLCVNPYPDIEKNFDW